MNSENKNRFYTILIFIIVIIFTISIIQLVGIGIDFLRLKLGLPIEKTRSIKEDESRDKKEILEGVLLPETKIKDSEEELKKAFQEYSISDIYYINKSPYDDFLNNSFKVALKGDFEKAIIVVNGKSLDDKPKFISLTLNNTSGVLNGVRKSVDELDINTTREKGGLFEGEFTFEIDLFGETFLSTTKDEFLKTRNLNKRLKFWDDIIPPPPTTFRLLFAPFGIDGIYRNTEITSIKFKYICKNDNCAVARCSPTEKTTVCLERNFGLNEAKVWCERTKAQGCENLK